MQEAIEEGIRMFVVCGGDGTTASVARAITGTNATLGIIPTGTHNNVALSLGIPKDIHAAIALLRTGRRIKVDVGIATCDGVSTPFVELCSVGLFSTLYSSADDIQHGKLNRIGEFISNLTSTPKSKISLLLDNKKVVKESGHVVMVSNMPFVGRNYRVGNPESYRDGYLDVMFFSELSKLDLLGYILKGPGTDALSDSRIKHYRVREIEINTNPVMPVMADEMTLGQGMVRIEVKRKALSIMANNAVPEEEPGEDLEV